MVCTDFGSFMVHSSGVFNITKLMNHHHLVKSLCIATVYHTFNWAISLCAIVQLIRHVQRSNEHCARNKQFVEPVGHLIEHSEKWIR